jgi:hypothetical protein
MRLLESVIRYGRKPVSSSMLAACLLALGTTTPGFSSSPNPETIQATYTQNGNAVSVTLIIYEYTTPLVKQVLSQAFDERQEQGLAAALSITKTAGLCSITGSDSIEIAFIQTVLTPTGRQITFMTNRPLQSDEAKPSAESESFDMLVGQFDINDNDNAKSTGFLYPASRLVGDAQGEFHYDLTGNPLSLVKILDSSWSHVLAERPNPNAMRSSTQQSPQ